MRLALKLMNDGAITAYGIIILWHVYHRQKFVIFYALFSLKMHQIIIEKQMSLFCDSLCLFANEKKIELQIKYKQKLIFGSFAAIIKLTKLENVI